MKKNRPYKYNSKSRLTQNSQSFPFKVNTIKKDVKTNLENTLTKLRIIEDVTPEEEEKLDNSFLGGRNEKKGKKKETRLVDEEKKLERVASLKKLFLTISGVCCAILFLLLASKFVGQKVSSLYHSARNRIVVLDKKNSNVIDDNYLFVGDFHTRNYDFKKYNLDYHYVNNGNTTYTTGQLLNNMKDMVYDYNPSIIFLELGILDLNSGMSEDEIIKNYSKIIDLIHNNRPNAVIFIESVYPINRDVDKFNNRVISSNINNEDITSFNKRLKNLAKDKKVEYIDMYSVISSKNELNSDYTDDGVTLNSKGYKELNKEIVKLLG